MQKSDELSIQEKVQVAMDFLKATKKPVSIAAIARLAGVSRANLYSTHMQLVALIRSERKPSDTPKKPTSARLLHLEYKTLVENLSSTCLELRYALDQELARRHALEEEVAKLRADLRRARSPK